MWRQFSSWLGGMGIIVLALAVLPRLRVGGRQLLESEMPGPELEFTDRIRTIARRLWFLYIALTALLIAILTFFGVVGIDRRMGLFEATSAAFATLPLGGFMPENRSFEEFAAATQWVVVIFMVVVGANFALTYRALVQRRPGIALRDEELRLYLLVLAAATALVTAQLWGESIFEGEAAVRHATFQVVSIMTTTGFASVDYVLWPTMTIMALVLLMFAGASAGSTSGSVKIVRHLLLAKVLRRELRQTVHPEEVMPIRFNGTPVDERTVRAVIAFVLLYIGLFAVGAGVIAIDAAIGGPVAHAVRRHRSLGHDARERGAGSRSGRANGILRELLGYVDRHHDPAHVARQAGGDPARRARHAPLLARLAPTYSGGSVCERSLRKAATCATFPTTTSVSPCWTMSSGWAPDTGSGSRSMAITVAPVRRRNAHSPRERPIAQLPSETGTHSI